MPQVTGSNFGIGYKFNILYRKLYQKSTYSVLKNHVSQALFQTWGSVSYILFIFALFIVQISEALDCKMVNLWRHDWQVNFSNMGQCDRYLSQLDFFDQ